ncbi:MAG: PLP-dependent transferase, partial [Chloroflexi bacterium]|nr:PLP-dependent transferase [Chloroflexota bacterium]
LMLMVNIQEFKLGSFIVDSKHFIGNIKIVENKIRYWDRPEDYVLEMHEIESVLKLAPKIIVIGTGAGGLLKVSDAIRQRILRNNIEMVVDIAKRHKLMTVMDNTFATPYFLRPIEYGVDLVVHSTTKYLNGHCDVVGGAVVTSTDELTERVQFLLNAMGTCASPFDCWLVLRGIETLAVRMRQHQENAAAVAKYLAGHPAVKRVFYPGLESHPGHQIAKRQMKGFGGMVSFEVKGGVTAVNACLKRIKVFALAESLGGAASLAEYPATMSHASMPKEFREKVGITDELIRLSVGLENVNDLVEDLRQALESS